MSRIKRARIGKLALGEERRLTAGGAHHRAPAWSRDGRLLAFAAGHLDDSAWCVVDRRGRVVRVLEGPAAGTASFAPDGSIAFERRFGATSEIWLTPGGDAPPVRLLGGDGRLYRDPAFSPDGATLACTTADEPDGATHLSLVSLATGRAIAVTSVPDRSDAHPSFTPDGNELVFQGARADDHGIYALHLQHSTLDRLTPAGERARRPVAIDPYLVLYQADSDEGRTTLVLLDRETKRAQRVVDDAILRGEPACHVGKGGKLRIAYAAQGAETAAPGEPPRFDIYTARLRGVTALGAPRGEPTDAEADLSPATEPSR